MTKILVADDETDLEVLIRQKFRQKIREQKYEFDLHCSPAVHLNVFRRPSSLCSSRP